jgi:hypothetical protein
MAVAVATRSHGSAITHKLGSYVFFYCNCCLIEIKGYTRFQLNHLGEMHMSVHVCTFNF